VEQARKDERTGSRTEIAGFRFNAGLSAGCSGETGVEIGLKLADVAVDCCTTKAPCGGEKAGKSPVDRGKQGVKHSTAVDARSIPLGVITAPVNRHDSPLLSETLGTLEVLGGLPEQARVHLERGYDSNATRDRLEDRGLIAEIPGMAKRPR
jgi:hypothetical protein